MMLPQDSSKNRAGPYSFGELRELFADGGVGVKTLVWAQGMDGWKGLLQVPQLKWSLVATVSIRRLVIRSTIQGMYRPG